MNSGYYFSNMTQIIRHAQLTWLLRIILWKSRWSSVNDNEKIESLFEEGLKYYRSGNYFEAHESWEEMWSDYYLVDRRFIQGLIQLSVSFVHLENGNIKGAKSLLNKSIEKFEEFNGTQRGIDLNDLLKQINEVNNVYTNLISLDTFDWDIIPKI